MKNSPNTKSTRKNNKDYKKNSDFLNHKRIQIVQKKIVKNIKRIPIIIFTLKMVVILPKKKID